MNKEREVWTNIIALYKDLPHLWEKKNAIYLNRNMRDEGFKMLLEVYKKIDDSATMQNFKRKLENMRTCYSREYKKVKTSTRTGSGKNDTYIPSLWYYDLLHFLQESNEPSRDAIDTLDEVIDTQESEHFLNSQTVERKSKKARMGIAKQQHDLMLSAQKLLDSKEEEWEIMAKSIAIQLKDLNKEQLTIANKIISDTIFYGKMGSLTVNSSINLGTPSSTVSPYQPVPFPQYTTQLNYSSFEPHSHLQMQASSALSNNDSPSPCSSVHSSSPKHQIEIQSFQNDKTSTPRHYTSVSRSDPLSQSQQDAIQSSSTLNLIPNSSSTLLNADDVPNTTFSNELIIKVEGTNSIV